jgi:5-(carboxyamino)imidazole ribonucleotide synthase
VKDEAGKAPLAPVVGMVGAGQLARMTCQAAIALGTGFRVLAGSAGESAAQVCAGTVTGDYTSLPDLLAFAAGCDVVTFDHEHVPGGHLAGLERAGVAVRPSAAALRHTQDKLAMRERLGGLGVPCPRYRLVSSLAEVVEFAAGSGWPVVLKAVSGGYDGRGVWVCDNPEQAAAVLAHPVAVMVEEFVPFTRELAAVAARSPHGQAAAYPVVQTVQVGGICHEVIAPAPGLSPVLAHQAQRIALELARELGVTGILAVELFETSGGLLVNELAMRPHNSGHWTIDGARTSQFEQHLRAVLDLPLGDPRAREPWAVMANVFGGEDPRVYQRYPHVMAADPGVKVHLYGKQPRPGRKIGHVTVAGGELAELRERAGRAARYLSEGKD